MDRIEEFEKTVPSEFAIEDPVRMYLKEIEYRKGRRFSAKSIDGGKFAPCRKHCKTFHRARNTVA